MKKGTWGQWTDYERAIDPCCQESQHHSWASSGGVLPSGQELPSLLSAAETTLEVLCPVLDSSAGERHGHAGVSPSKGHRDH